MSSTTATVTTFKWLTLVIYYRRTSISATIIAANSYLLPITFRSFTTYTDIENLIFWCLIISPGFTSLTFSCSPAFQGIYSINRNRKRLCRTLVFEKASQLIILCIYSNICHYRTRTFWRYTICLIISPCCSR